MYLSHIRDSIKNILDDTSKGKRDFFANRTIQDAVVRNLEIVGEAVKNIPEEFKNLHPEIAWKGIAGMRDKLIHEYFTSG